MRNVKIIGLILIFLICSIGILPSIIAQENTNSALKETVNDIYDKPLDIDNSKNSSSLINHAVKITKKDNHDLDKNIVDDIIDAMNDFRNKFKPDVIDKDKNKSIAFNEGIPIKSDKADSVNKLLSNYNYTDMRTNDSLTNLELTAILDFYDEMVEKEALNFYMAYCELVEKNNDSIYIKTDGSNYGMRVSELLNVPYYNQTIPVLDEVIVKYSHMSKDDKAWFLVTKKASDENTKKVLESCTNDNAKLNYIMNRAVPILSNISEYKGSCVNIEALNKYVKDTRETINDFNANVLQADQAYKLGVDDHETLFLQKANYTGLSDEIYEIGGKLHGTGVRTIMSGVTMIVSGIIAGTIAYGVYFEGVQKSVGLFYDSLMVPVQSCFGVQYQMLESPPLYSVEAGQQVIREAPKSKVGLITLGPIGVAIAVTLGVGALVLIGLGIYFIILGVELIRLADRLHEISTTIKEFN
ncbi:MAG: hypothetical protein LBR15_11090 [Methanobrevibacter sp.]|jgi:hypothetical protein|nr:hypothetical protein [Candidatus Methanovirga australis]